MLFCHQISYINQVVYLDNKFCNLSNKVISFFSVWFFFLTQWRWQQGNNDFREVGHKLVVEQQMLLVYVWHSADLEMEAVGNNL